jgi:hypothetical protein
MTEVRGGPARRSAKKPKESLQQLLDEGFGLIFVEVSRAARGVLSRPAKGLPAKFAPLEGKRAFPVGRLPSFPKEDDADAWFDWMAPRAIYFENVDASPYDLPGIVVVAGRKKPRIVRVARFAAGSARRSRRGRR